jgi:UDP-galactopyranose mutase
MQLSTRAAQSFVPAGVQGKSLLICFSHLRWDFVFQRPQHLMSRFAEDRQTVFWEEPIRSESGSSNLSLRTCDATGVIVATPQLAVGLSLEAENALTKELLDSFLADHRGSVTRWYYTPMMLSFSEHVPADCVVYDCMDELANFKGAPVELLVQEQRLFAQADVVFTGGFSLFEAKRGRHANIHPFPSGVDVDHFGKARLRGEDPVEQRDIPRPRFGFYGVIDERMDLTLLAELADARPDRSFVIIGPVVKIGEDELPRRPNIFYLGGKSYAELPEYVRGWDVAIMPFAINDATRFISPTKTPEFLAAGLPVVSTPITDVARHFGSIKAVAIAGTPADFTKACDEALERSGTFGSWRDEVEAALSECSWDETFRQMHALIARSVAAGLDDMVVAPTIWPAPCANKYDAMVVGAGFAGAVMAERLASQSGKRVLVVDRRPHVGGNAYDHLDAAGVLIHQYGPHIFHTNSKEVVDYLSKFTSWRPYEHRVLAAVGDKLVPMPINRTTLNMLYGRDLQTEEAAASFLKARAEPVERVRTSEDVVVSAVGRDLYETFFRGYTRKQWGMDPSELDKSVTSRVPTRTDDDDRYFTDSFQAMPDEGYTRMFERMLDHPNIDVLLGVDYVQARNDYPHDQLVFTGPIDEYFGFRFGKLPYRSLRFQHVTVDQEWVQDVAVINYPSEDVPYTRVTEYKHLTGQQIGCSSLTYEFPATEGDPYYPVPRDENQVLFKRYEALADAQTDVMFVGRLATYRYYNMDQVVAQALATYRKATLRGADPIERASAIRVAAA